MLQHNIFTLSCILVAFSAVEAATYSGNAVITYYNSYPKCCQGSPAYDSNAPTSECSDYSGCKYQGMFAYWSDKKSYSWVKSHNIVAFYDNSNPSGSNWRSNYGGRLITLTKWGKTFTAIIADTCGNDDCNNCCSKNSKGGTLVDVEYNTLLNVFGTTDAADGTISFSIGGYPNSDADYAFSGATAAPSTPSPTSTVTASPPYNSPTHTIWDDAFQHDWTDGTIDSQQGWRANTLTTATTTDGHGTVIKFQLQQTAALGFLRTTGSVNWSSKGYSVLKFNIALAPGTSYPTVGKLYVGFRNADNSNPGTTKAVTVYNDADWHSYTANLSDIAGSAFPNFDSSCKVIFKWDNGSSNESPTIYIDDIRFTA